MRSPHTVSSQGRTPQGRISRRGSYGQLVDSSPNTLRKTLPLGTMTSQGHIRRNGSQGQLVDSSPKRLRRTLPSGTMTSQRHIRLNGSQGQLVDSSPDTLHRALPSGTVTSVENNPRRGSQGQLVDQPPNTLPRTLQRTGPLDTSTSQGGIPRCGSYGKLVDPPPNTLHLTLPSGKKARQGQIPRSGSQGQLVDSSSNRPHRTLPSGTVTSVGHIPRSGSQGQLVESSSNRPHWTLPSGTVTSVGHIPRSGSQGQLVDSSPYRPNRTLPSGTVTSVGHIPRSGSQGQLVDSSSNTLSLTLPSGTMTSRGKLPRRCSQGLLVDLSRNTLYLTRPSDTMTSQGHTPRRASVGQLLVDQQNTLHRTLPSGALASQGQIPRRGSLGQLLDQSNTLHRTLPSGTLTSQEQITRRGSFGQLVDQSNTLQWAQPSGTLTSQGQFSRRPSQGQLVGPSRNSLHYTVHSSHFQGRKKDAWWQIAILCLPCLVVLLVFGLFPAMKRSIRIICSFFAVTLISVIAGSVLVTTNYSSYHFTATTGDQRPLYSKYSTYFCSDFDVVSQKDQIGVFFFNELPPMNPKKFERSAEARRTTIYPNEYEVIQFYLLEGSEIKATIEVSNHHNSMRKVGPLYGVYLIQGERNFAAWKSNHDDHRRYKITLTNQAELVYNVTESAVYYVIVTNESIYGTIDVNVSLLLKKTQYNLTDRLRKCFSKNGNICSFSLDFGSDEIAILDIDYENDGGRKGYNITTACRSNKMMYVLTFLASPMIFLVLWSAMIWVCFKPKKEENPAMRPLELGLEVTHSMCESSCNGRAGRRGSRDLDSVIGLFRNPLDVQFNDRTAPVEKDQQELEEAGPVELGLTSLSSGCDVSLTQDRRGSRDLDVGLFRTPSEVPFRERISSANNYTYAFEHDGSYQLDAASVSSVSGVSNPMYNTSLHGELRSPSAPMEEQGDLHELSASTGRSPSFHHVHGICNPFINYTMYTPQVENEASSTSMEEQGIIEMSVERLRTLREIPNSIDHCTMLDREGPSVPESESPGPGPPNMHRRPGRLPSTRHIPSRDQSGLVENEEKENEIFWV